ncbi:DNRLRE domain-containing protein [Streptosporangium canum]|uniref:DNRLRE domain-containing protein n=1 Tax=Streptosporangium canum TaxID=324952 RepID=UPI0033A8B375
MPFEFLSDEQVARYGRFPKEPSVAELKQFFRLDRPALDKLASKRRPATRLGWATQWGTVRMLGVFLTENPTAAGWLRAGTTQTSADIARTYLKFNTTAPELEGATVVDADLYVWNYKSGGPNGQLCGNEIGSGIAASLITSAWTPTGLSWSNQPSSAGIMGGSGNKAGYNIDASGTWCASEAALVHRITGMARAWIEQDVANHGLVLRAVTESPAINWRQYYASEYSGAPYPGYRHPPTLMVEYTPAPEYPPGDDAGWFKAGEGFPDSATADQIRAATYRSSQPIEAGEVSDAEAEAMQGQAPEFVENPAVTFGRPADVSQEEWNSLNPNNPRPDPDQPSVIRTVPDLGATNAQPDVHVEARFSEPVTGRTSPSRTAQVRRCPAHQAPTLQETARHSSLTRPSRPACSTPRRSAGPGRRRASDGGAVQLAVHHHVVDLHPHADAHRPARRAADDLAASASRHMGGRPGISRTVRANALVRRIRL